MNERINPQGWLDAGLEILAQHGHEQLKIMLVAKHLGVTKGSFYWHFTSLDAYQQALITEWEHCHTQQAIECVEQMAVDAQTKLRVWLTGASISNFQLAKSIRTWAQTNSMIYEVQERVDQQRTAYLIQLLKAIGWPEMQAITLGQWTYWAFIGFSSQAQPAIGTEQISLILTILTPKQS